MLEAVDCRTYACINEHVSLAWTKKCMYLAQHYFATIPKTFSSISQVGYLEAPKENDLVLAEQF